MVVTADLQMWSKGKSGSMKEKISKLEMEVKRLIEKGNGGLEL